MYQEFFNLKELPYQITPDPRFLFSSTQHNGAINRCRYVIQEHRGLAVIYGEIGMGKTTIARRLYELTRDEKSTQVAMLVTPALKTANAFLQAIMQEFNVATKRSYGDSLIAFGDFLIESRKKGLNTALIIDEAQKLTPKMLDVIHSILNFESSKEKFIQIVLIGQKELVDNLDRNPPVRSRVSAWGELEPLTKDDTKDLIAFRWSAATGGKGSDPFTEDAIHDIYGFSGGLPREIVKLCNESLENAAFIESKEVTADMVVEAAKDLRLKQKAEV